MIDNVIFLSHFTGTAVNEIMEYDADFFNDLLLSVKELYKAESEKIYRIVVVGYEKRR